MEIGLKRGTVRVEEHRTEWEIQARQTIALLKSILKDTAVDIRHVGSTAIRGICAKPIIDIAVGVLSLDDILFHNEELEANGFIFRGSDLPGQYLYVCGGEDFRTHHIHITEYGSASWKNYLYLTDYLNSHEDEAKAYSDLKLMLAEKYPEDRDAYTKAKSSMIDDILRKAKCSAMEPIIVVYDSSLKSEVFRFTAECFEELGKKFEPDGRHAFYNEIDDFFERFWCLVDEDRVKGTVAIKRLDDTTAELKALYVDSSLRGEGWGYKLLDGAVAFAREEGFEAVVLDSMSRYKAADKLYRRYGFKDTKRYNDNMYADVFMKMRLSR